jgi:hypothetical protein
MRALGRIGDAHAQMLIGEILLASDNPFLLVRGVQAMEDFGTPASVPLLLDLLRNEHLPAHVADEAILVLSSLMDIQRKFYHVFENWVRDRKNGAKLLEDILDEQFTRKKQQDPVLKKVIADFMLDPLKDSPFVRWVLDFGKGHTGVYSALLVGVALDADLKRLDSFRFFLCFWAATVFVNPALIEK